MPRSRLLGVRVHLRLASVDREVSGQLVSRRNDARTCTYRQHARRSTVTSLRVTSFRHVLFMAWESARFMFFLMFLKMYTVLKLIYRNWRKFIGPFLNDFEKTVQRITCNTAFELESILTLPQQGTNANVHVLWSCARLTCTRAFQSRNSLATASRVIWQENNNRGQWSEGEGGRKRPQSTSPRPSARACHAQAVTSHLLEGEVSRERVIVSRIEGQHQRRANAIHGLTTSAGGKPNRTRYPLNPFHDQNRNSKTETYSYIDLRAWKTYEAI